MGAAARHAGSVTRTVEKTVTPHWQFNLLGMVRFFSPENEVLQMFVHLRQFNHLAFDMLGSLAPGFAEKNLSFVRCHVTYGPARALESSTRCE